LIFPPGGVFHRQVEKKVIEAGLRDKLKSLLAELPLSKEFANQAGADGYAADPGPAGKLAKSLLLRLAASN